MKIQIIGADSAFDGLNTSFFVRDDAGRGILVDCGFTVYPELNRRGMLGDIDIVLISQTHADHSGSLTTLCAKRKKMGAPVALGGADVAPLFQIVEGRTDMFTPLTDDLLKVEYLETEHISGVMKNKAMLIADTIFYSGDTRESLLDTEFARGAKIIIHETSLDTPVAHVPLAELARAPADIRAKTWLIHIPTNERDEITRLAAEYGFAGVCQNGQEIEI
ncbi:MAG: MBL fold metallo-hydrolase [Rickettsiales bacterium]|jgi:ribonuclease BN (tRNA processing enzyme)|nr:MBL fold metallo-hydrolase [Rickettsiales bacterium]